MKTESGTEISAGKRKTASIRQILQSSYIVIICLMLIAPVISIASSWLQIARYDRTITNVSQTNRLNQIVKTEISNEIWDIVAGSRGFDEGRQYEILYDIGRRLDLIFKNTEITENRRMLEVAGRALDTLSRYVDRLGYQIQEQYPVTENEDILDEIRGVSELISDILQEFIVLEIEAASITNENIKQISVMLSILQIMIVIFVMLFSIFTQRYVSTTINLPIRELENLSSEIASGNLAARADQPHVEELDNLTENLNIMAEKIKKLIEANIEEQKNFQKSEMKALQAQITPHFLYNTLDTIVWLAEGRRHDEVIDVARNFSSFFRTTLNKGRDWTSVQNEYEHACNYLSIQKVRYRDILNYEIEFDESMMQESMLKLLLQPIVENALYHGIKNKRGRGNLLVKGWRDNAFLYFRVDDDGIGIQPERLEDIKHQMNSEADHSAVGDVYGLYNVNKRLELYYNGRASLEIQSEYLKGTSVTFRVPEVENV